jgi:hypothetical protein
VDAAPWRRPILDSDLVAVYHASASVDRQCCASEVVPEDLVHTVVYRRITASPRAQNPGGAAEELAEEMLAPAADRIRMARFLPTDRFPFNR